MPCLCTTSTLRLFIRSVAQVDLPNTAKFVASRQLPMRYIPAMNHPHTSRAYSSASALRYQDEIEDYEVNSSSKVETKPWQRKHDNANQLGHADSDAIAEFSADAIDAIAAEAAAEAVQDTNDFAAETYEYETPWKSLLKGMPERKKYTPMEQVPGTVVRRGRSENTGFKIHYSAAPDWEMVKAHHARFEEEKRAKTETAKDAKDDWVPPPKEPWMIEKEVLREKYPDGYNPLKRLSPDAIAGIRAIHAQMPEQYTVQTLAKEFSISPEAIRRILKSKWRPNSEEQTEREERWVKRGERVWSRLADMGTKPPRQWRDMGIGQGRPDWMKRTETSRAPRAPRAPLPALVTTARRKQAKLQTSQEENLADRII